MYQSFGRCERLLTHYAKPSRKYFREASFILNRTLARFGREREYLERGYAILVLLLFIPSVTMLTQSVDCTVWDVCCLLSKA